MSIKIFFRELTPTGNETPMAVDTLLSSDEEGSFIKYKRDEKAVKRKIEDEHLDKIIEPKKRLLNGDKTPIEESPPDRVFSDHSYCVPQQVYSPPPIADWESQLDTVDKIESTKPVVISEPKVQEVSPKKIKQPLAVRDGNKVITVDRSSIQKYRDNQVKTKYFNRRDGMKEASVVFEFLTKGIDLEDIHYLKQSYEYLLANEPIYYWLNETHWVNHPDILLITLVVI